MGWNPLAPGATVALFQHVRATAEDVHEETLAVLQTQALAAYNFFDVITNTADLGGRRRGPSTGGASLPAPAALSVAGTGAVTVTAPLPVTGPSGGGAAAAPLAVPQVSQVPSKKRKRDEGSGGGAAAAPAPPAAAAPPQQGPTQGRPTVGKAAAEGGAAAAPAAAAPPQQGSTLGTAAAVGGAADAPPAAPPTADDASGKGPTLPPTIDQRREMAKRNLEKLSQAKGLSSEEYARKWLQCSPQEYVNKEVSEAGHCCWRLGLTGSDSDSLSHSLALSH